MPTKLLLIEGQRVNPFRANSFITDQLIEPFRLKHPNEIEFISREWNDSLGTGDFDILIGHSLGGHAAIAACELSLKNGYNLPKHLITLDPRWMDNRGWMGAVGLGLLEKRYLPNFTKPLGVECFNFFHEGPWLPGYQAIGASNAKVYDNHLSVPGDPLVMECLEKLVGA